MSSAAEAASGGRVVVTPAGSNGVARITVDNPPKLNAIDVGMWQAIAKAFEALQALPPADAPRVVIVCGADGQFAAGGDIEEFSSFRFDPKLLRDFHEAIVGPALAAMAACDIPLIAQIDGNCIGGGLEIAACCDIRLCGDSSRFGAPIARLGFPMAPGELQLLHAIAPAAVLREMLLEARLLDAGEALRHGMVHAVLPDAGLGVAVQQRAERMAALSGEAARINKQTLRQIAGGGPTSAEREAHYRYADSADHREGIAAFLDKRAPQFGR
jgi:enoyl-CoA hydratase/carnithine racemase